MPTNDPNVPDLSLGERDDKVTSVPPSIPLPPRETEIQRADDVVPRPTARDEFVPEAPRQWQEGDRVFAPWEPEFLYPGRIRQIRVDEDRGDQALIRYDDGGEGWVFVYSLRPVQCTPGDRVQARRGGGPQYMPGELAEVEGDEVRVAFDDGTNDWLSMASVRFPCVPEGPGAAGTQSAPWQTPAPVPSSGVPSWVITLGLFLLIFLLRVGCRMMQN